jgi:hypothetical protein
MSNILALCDTVRQTSLAIHQYFRSGHLEKVYENMLAHRLRNKAIDVGMLINFGSQKLQIRKLIL